MAVQFSQHHLLKDSPFSSLYSWLLCHKLIDHIYMFWLFFNLSKNEEKNLSLTKTIDWIWPMDGSLPTHGLQQPTSILLLIICWWLQVSFCGSMCFTLRHRLGCKNSPYLGHTSLAGFSYCSWESQGKNAEVVCHSLLQWTTFCQNSLPWPVHLGWPYTVWLIVSLS